VVTARWGNGEHSDRYNSDYADKRRDFLDTVADRIGLSAGALHHLDAIIWREAASADENAARPSDPDEGTRSDPLQETPPEVIQDAEGFLRHDRLFQELSRDLSVMGVVGEERLATTIYLVATSARLSGAWFVEKHDGERHVSPNN
jgi:hypothetical protein